MRIPKYVYINPFFRYCKTISNERHIFVVGAPRSGTTLLANVVANHSNICSIPGETGLFRWINCFFLFEGNAGRNSYEFNKIREQCSDVVKLFDRIADQCMRDQECARFLEKTPSHVFNLDFIIKHFPNAKILNIIRDVRDCYVSSKSNSDVPQNTAQSFAKYWRRSIETRNKFANHSSITDVRYETFVSNPASDLTRIMRWIGEIYEPEQISPQLMSKDPRAGSCQFRLLGGDISTKSVGRWQKELLSNEILIIEEIVGDLLYM